MPSGRYNIFRWGADFPLYLNSTDPFFPMASNIGLERAKQAIQEIEVAGSLITPPPHFTHFYPILHLQSNPRDLWTLKDTRIVSGCIGLLRQYTEDIKDSGKGLLSHSFGFYCFRTMILGIQIGILSHTDTFDSFIRKYGRLDTADRVCVALSRFVNKLIVQSEMKRDSLTMMGARNLSSIDQRLFLESVGGFLNSDVGFLLEALWNDRGVLTSILTKFPTPGWATMLWIMGRHMLWAMYLEADESYEWGHLRALCFRYSLFATPNENFYIRRICGDYQEYRCDVKAECLEFTVDQDDAENVINAYISRITPSSDQPIYDIDMASLFIDFIPQDGLLKPAHLMPAFIEASLSRIWNEWDECPDEDTSIHTSFILYCAGIFEAICKMFQLHPDGTAARQMASTLNSNDFVELIGRMVLSPLVKGCLLIKYLRMPDKSFACLTLDQERWDKVLQSLFMFAYWLPHGAQMEFSSSHREWEKTQRWLSTYSTVQLPSRTVKYAVKCRQVWNTLGLAFGYFSPDTAGEERLCAYARCPKPVLDCNSGFACSLCLETLYCGHECQAKHWDGISPESHRNNCVGFVDHTSTDVPQ